MARKKIGALLEDKGYINEFQLVAALSHQRKWKTKLGQSLIELGYLEEDQLFEVLAEQLGLELVKLRKVEIAPDILKKTSKEIAKQWLAMPLKYENNTWVVAVAEPEKPGLAEAMQQALGGPVKFVLATTLELENKIRKIPDKVPVASVQPVKKAFVRNSNGQLEPAPYLGDEAAPAADEELFLGGDDTPGLGIDSLDEPADLIEPAPEAMLEEAPLEPAPEDEVMLPAMDEAPPLPADEIPTMAGEEQMLPPIEEAPPADLLPEPSDDEILPPMEEEAPPMPVAMDEAPPIPMDDAPPIPLEEEAPAVPPAMDEAPPIPMDDVPPIPLEAEAPAVPPAMDEAPPIPMDDAPPIPLEAEAPAVPPAMDEAPPLPMDDAPPPLEEEAPSVPPAMDEAPPIPMDDAPPIPLEDEGPPDFGVPQDGPPDLDSSLMGDADEPLPLEAPHESAAAITADEASSERTDVVNLGDLLPPAQDLQPDPAADSLGAPPSLDEPPSLDAPPSLDDVWGGEPEPAANQDDYSSVPPPTDDEMETLSPDDSFMEAESGAPAPVEPSSLDAPPSLEDSVAPDLSVPDSAPPMEPGESSAELDQMFAPPEAGEAAEAPPDFELPTLDSPGLEPPGLDSPGLEPPGLEPPGLDDAMTLEPGDTAEPEPAPAMPETPAPAESATAAGAADPDELARRIETLEEQARQINEAVSELKKLLPPK